MKLIERDEIDVEEQNWAHQVETSDRNIEPQELIDLKVDLWELTHLNKALFEGESGNGIAKCLGPALLVGILSWALVFGFVDYLI